MENGKRRVAVVLSGGGAKGAYEVGVLKALKARGVEPDIYTGTSVGSFNAAMLASGKPIEEVEKVWLNLTTAGVFELRYDPRKLVSLDPRPSLRFAIGSIKLIGGFVSEALKSGGSWWETIDLDSFLLDTSPLGELIARNVDIAALRGSSKEIYIALTRLKPVESNALEIVDREHITHDHILASCSLPLIFPSVSIGAATYCDGGVVMNSPLKPAVDAGADEIYILDLTPLPKTFQDATLPLAYHVLSAQFSTALNSDIQYAEGLNRQYLAAHSDGKLVEGKFEVSSYGTGKMDFGRVRRRSYRYLRMHVIRPSTDLGGLAGFLKFDPDIAAEWIKAGEKDAEASLAQHYEADVQAPDGAAMKALLRG